MGALGDEAVHRRGLGGDVEGKDQGPVEPNVPHPRRLTQEVPDLELRHDRNRVVGFAPRDNECRNPVGFSVDGRRTRGVPAQVHDVTGVIRQKAVEAACFHRVQEPVKVAQASGPGPLSKLCGHR